MVDVRPSPRHALLKAWTRTRTRGPGEVARGLASQLAENVTSHDALLFLARATSPGHDDPPGVELFAANAGDGARYARDIGTDSPATFAARLTPHTRCFLAARGDRLLHASWVTTCAAWTRELRRYVLPPRGDAYVYESFTHSDARGLGIYPAALRFIASWLAERNVERAWVAVEEDNPPSLRAVSKAGFSEQFVIRYRRRAGRLTIELPADFTGGWELSRRGPEPGACDDLLLR